MPVKDSGGERRSWQWISRSGSRSDSCESREGRKDWIGRVSERDAVLESLSQANQESLSKVCVLQPAPRSPTCPSLPGRSPEEVRPRHGCCGELKVQQLEAISQTLPEQCFWKGVLNSGLHGHRKGIRWSLWVQKCNFFFLPFPSILITATLWQVWLFQPKHPTGTDNKDIVNLWLSFLSSYSIIAMCFVVILSCLFLFK